MTGVAGEAFFAGNCTGGGGRPRFRGTACCVLAECEQTGSWVAGGAAASPRARALEPRRGRVMFTLGSLLAKLEDELEVTDDTEGRRLSSKSAEADGASDGVLTLQEKREKSFDVR